jgi:rubrerythrin
LRVAAAALVGDDAMLERLIDSEDEAIGAYSAAASDAALSETLRRRLAALSQRERDHREWMRHWLASNYG